MLNFDNLGLRLNSKWRKAAVCVCFLSIGLVFGSSYFKELPPPLPNVIAKVPSIKKRVQVFGENKVLKAGAMERSLRRSEEKLMPQRRLSYGALQKLISNQGSKRGKSRSPYFQLKPSKKRSHKSKQKEKAPSERFPLEETHAEVDIAGVIAQVQIRQVYRNRGTSPIEATYVFPASTKAAIHGMRMKIGKRIIEAQIQERNKARKTFQNARNSGKRAALLEQQRDNVFTMQVTNIMPGDRVEVQIDYSELLVPSKGVYKFVYPAVVGPRYSSGVDKKREPWSTNPYLKKGHKKGSSGLPYRFSFKMNVQSPIGIKEMLSPSHKLQISYQSPKKARVTLKDADAGNRDVVIRYRLAGDKIESGVMQFSNNKENFFLMMMEPPKRVKPKNIPPREYLFILDVSCSMSGFPLNTAKKAMNKLLGGMRKSDSFNVILFAGTSHLMNPRSIVATPKNIRRAMQVIDRQRGGGGTELMGALKRAYNIPRKSENIARTVLVVTDGYVTVEPKVFQYVRKNVSNANLFVFGIGNSVNRGLIEGMSRAGMGEPFVILNQRQATKKAKHFQEYISSPLLTRISYQVKGAKVSDVWPRKLPDLLAQRPLILIGKYKGRKKAQIKISGYTGQGRFQRTLSLNPSKASKENRALRPLWARKWSQMLTDQYYLLGGNKELRGTLVQLGLRYQLMTSFTSFVAVDNRIVRKGGQLQNIRQALPMPKGVYRKALAGKRFGRMRVGSGGLGRTGYGFGGGGSGSGRSYQPRSRKFYGSKGISGIGGLGVGRLGTYGRGVLKRKRVRSVSRVSSVRPSIKGSISRSVLRRVIRRKFRRIRSFYERGLKSNSRLAGKVVVTFIIGIDGRVKSAKILSDTMKDPSFNRSLLRLFRRLRFPRPVGGGVVSVIYPFVFSR